ncbi:IPT/TIG domain-containing protein [Nocardia salmonicida]|uniref:IPT/TIG domain-containing protein n=1 Tax=Nocardia salmonicida TaxID=53431 RepID=UPI0036B1A077
MSAITSLAPTTGPAIGAASVTTTGTDFGWPTTTRFGNTATSFTTGAAARSIPIALP